MKKIFFISFYLYVCVNAGCIKEVTPSDAITPDILTSSVEGLTQAVNGAYALFKDHVDFNGTADDNNMYLRQYFQMSDFASDDIVCGQVTEDPLFLSFSLNHSPAQTNSRYFWFISYKVINDVNTVIEATEKIADPDATINQLKGECYFLRAFCHFNLVRFYARPYSQDPNADGIILRLSTSDPAITPRSSVKDVYASIIDDAQKAADLMTQPRGVAYASQEAAWALLSRVYLYEEDNEKAIEYATKVINSGRFELTNKTTFLDLF